MPITVTEKFESRETIDGQSIELLYVLEGTDSDTAAMSQLKQEAPTAYNQMKRQNCRIEPIGPGMWLGVAPYAPSEASPLPRAQTGDVRTSFDTAGGTQHITQGIANVTRTGPAGAGAPDYKGAIGVSGRAGDEVVEGVDKTLPVYNFAETHYLPDSQVTDAYKGKLFRLTGKTNNAVFRGLAIGECLFLGASGSQRNEDDWEISFRFAAFENETNIAIGDIIVPAKKGWEYLWVRYATKKVAGDVLKQPVAAYVEKIYKAGDYSQLGIGT